MIYHEKLFNYFFKNFLNIFFETFLFDVPLYMMPLVGSIHIPNMHSVKMYSLGSAQRRNAKNMALRNIFLILSNFHYRVHHEITLPSWRNRRFKKTDSYSSLQSRIQTTQSSPHYGSWLTGYRKIPDSWTWTHESLDWRMESVSAISEIYVIFTPRLNYVSRHADNFYICKNEHFEKNLYTKPWALRRIY